MNFESFQKLLGNSGDFFRPFSFKVSGKEVAGFALDKNEERSLVSAAFDEVSFPVTVSTPVADVWRPMADGKLAVAGDSSLARTASVVANTVSLAAVTEMRPKGSLLGIVPPDEVVDGLSREAELLVAHDDLIRTEAGLKLFSKKGSEDTPDLKARSLSSLNSGILSIPIGVFLIGRRVAPNLPGNGARRATK